MSPSIPVLDPAPHIDLLRRALQEDHAFSDLTSEVLVPAEASALAEIRFKQPGLVCGLPLLAPLFHLLDADAEVSCLCEDGARVAAGTVVAQVRGRARALLAGERTALNLLQRLSGIATQTAEFVEAAMASGVNVLDTRKTTPGLRLLEKYAVRCGGGHNHRLHLGDGAMIKENHLHAAYGTTGPEAVDRAVHALQQRLAPHTPLFVEVETLAELDAALAAGKSRGRNLIVMLDDFDIKGIRQAVDRLRALPSPRPLLEITGGVTLETMGALAATGVHRISSGRITHSACALDISLKMRPALPPTN